MTSFKYKLNKIGDSGQPCLTPWVITLESSDIPLPALFLIMFSILPEGSWKITTLKNCRWEVLKTRFSIRVFYSLRAASFQ